MRDSESEDQTGERSSLSMSTVWARFRDTLMDRLKVLERVGAELLEQGADESALREAEQSAGELSSSLDTFEMSRGAELASEIERLLRAGISEPGDIYRYSGLVVALRDQIEEGRPPQARLGEGATAAEGGGALLIVEPVQATAEALTAEAMVRGWPPERAITLAAAAERVGELDRIVAAVVDPAAGEAAELTVLMRALRRRRRPVPVVIHSAARSQEDRLRGISLDAGAFVQKGAPPATVLDRVDALLEEEAPSRATVLVVDQDEAVLHTVASILVELRLRISTLADPGHFWTTLEAVRPDLVLLDVDTPAVSGHRLCRTVRADPRWRLLPVLFMTGRSDPAAIVAGFDAGGDDYIAKPVTAPDLAARVAARLRPGAAAGGARAQGDAEGALSLLQLLRLQVALAAHYDEMLSVAILALQPPLAEAGRGTPAVEAAAMLTQAREPEDVVARIGRGEVLVSRYGERQGATGRWIRRVLNVPPGAHFPMGMAGYPDARTPEALLETARAALDAVGRTGPLRGGRAPQAEADIVVVEDDEAVGSLLAKTLSARGYSTHWIRDGTKASELLTGSPPVMRASVILLDVGLPGMDGFTLLRQLRRDGVTRRTRVVMVTARASQSEVMRSLELGAFDHVAKPFSMSELLHRVRRALGSDASA